MDEELNERIAREDVLRMAVDVVAAYVSNNQVPSAQIPEVIHSVFGSLCELEGASSEMRQEPQKPAVPIRKSVTPDYIVCLEDGKKLKMLKRHLHTTYRMTPEEYRAKWGLPSDYPMVAPNYAKQRSEFAKQIGLGRKAGDDSRRGRAKR
ncbi:MAG: transcriptional regulator [Rhodospirillales bacterium]|nr:MAG: transcriptional regulator [Rhodospirillales bacterium]